MKEKWFTRKLGMLLLSALAMTSCGVATSSHPQSSSGPAGTSEGTSEGVSSTVTEPTEASSEQAISPSSEESSTSLDDMSSLVEQTTESVPYITVSNEESTEEISSEENKEESIESSEEGSESSSEGESAEPSSEESPSEESSESSFEEESSVESSMEESVEQSSEEASSIEESIESSFEEESSEASSEESSEASSEESVESSSEEESIESSFEESSFEEESSEEPEESSIEEYDGPRITFDSGNSGQSSSITDLDEHYVAYDLDIASSSCSMVYGSLDSAIRFGTRNFIGKITFSFLAPVFIDGISIVASSYQSTAANVKVSNEQSSDTLAITDAKAVYETSSAFGKTTQISIESAEKGDRFLLYEIRFAFGEYIPTYPTEISLLPSSLSLEKGDVAQLEVNYLPEDTDAKEVSFASNDPSIATVTDEGVVTAVNSGSTEIVATAKSADGYVQANCSVTVAEEVVPGLEKTSIRQTYVDFTENNTWDIDSCPTVGEIHPLLIPIWFSDSNQFVTSAHKDDVRSDIEKAYFGTVEETGWHSVKSFYEEESKGALTIDGVCTDWYSCGKKVSNYSSSDSGGYATMDLVSSATDWYFSSANAKPRSYFDADSDGYLDAVLLIYAAPDYASWNKGDSYNNLWAYCYWLQNTSLNNRANPGPNSYFWASYDFMYGSSKASSRAGSSYAGGDTSHCTIDAHTFIHEMGHVFGLDDYYDYGSNGYSPAAGFSMQDQNVGGHDPYSVMAYGWADPYIPTQSTTIELKPFQKDHEIILLTPEWNDYDSPFDEYLLLELYTPTGLNELDSTYSYGSFCKGPSATGIRLWHVDARLLYCSEVDYQGEPKFKASQMTSTTKYNCKYGVVHAFSNTYGSQSYGSPLGTSYDNYNLLQLVRNSTSASHKNRNDISSSDLFGNGSSFSISKYSSQFINGGSGKLNSSKAFGWSFSVSITGTGDNAVASVELTKA